jgi:hypothetical protein
LTRSRFPRLGIVGLVLGGGLLVAIALADITSGQSANAACHADMRRFAQQQQIAAQSANDPLARETAVEEMSQAVDDCRAASQRTDEVTLADDVRAFLSQHPPTPTATPRGAPTPHG